MSEERETHPTDYGTSHFIRSPLPSQPSLIPTLHAAPFATRPHNRTWQASTMALLSAQSHQPSSAPSRKDTSQHGQASRPHSSRNISSSPWPQAKVTCAYSKNTSTPQKQPSRKTYPMQSPSTWTQSKNHKTHAPTKSMLHSYA